MNQFRLSVSAILYWLMMNWYIPNKLIPIGKDIQEMERCKSENWGMGNGKTLFMSDEEKHGHHFDLQLFFNISKQFLAPGGLSADCWVCLS